MALDEQLRRLADQVPVPPPGDAATLFRRGVRRRRLRRGASVAVVVAVLGVGVVSLIDGPALPDIADRPPAPAPPETEEGLDHDEREAAEVPFDPDRTVCAPVGCEVWRRSLGGMPPVPQWVAGSPVVIEDDQLVGLDLETGEVRWQLRIEDDLRAREGGSVDLSLGRVMLTGNDELVALANTQGVQLVSQAGETRWARSLPADGAHLRWVHVTGTSVLVVHEFPPVLADAEDLESGDELPLDVAITVLDTRDGQLRWSQEGSQGIFPLPTLADQEELLLVGGGDGVLSALDLASGEPRYELPGGADLWPDHAGGILTLRDLGGGSPDSSLLFDVSDGSLRAELPGSVRSSLDIDGRVIVLLERDGAGMQEASREAVAVDPDGSITWRHPVELAERCCPSILDLDGSSVRISDGPGVPALVVDVGDGSVRADDPLAAAPADSAAEQMQLGRRLLVEHPDRQDAPGYVLRDSSGRSLEITGSGSPGPMGGPSPDIILLATSRELIAVRFP